MERKALHIRLDTEIRETIKYIASRMGLKTSEFIRNTLCEKVDGLRDTLSFLEVEVIASNVKVENAKQKYEEAKRMNELVEEWSGRSD